MSKRADNITCLESGRFEARVTIDGRRVKQRFDTEAQASAFRDAVELDKALRKHGLPGIIKPRPRVRDLLRDYLDDQNQRRQQGTLSGGTVDHYWQCSEGWKRWLADQDLLDLRADELDDAMVERYVAWRQGRFLTKKSSRPASDVQVRKDLTQMVRVFRWAGITRTWRIPRKLRRNKGGKAVPELEQLFAFLEAMPEGSLERTAAETAIATGLRPSDVYALELDNLQLADRQLRLVTQKDQKTLIVPFGDQLARHLELWLERRMPTVHRRLFHLNGRPLDNHSLRVRYRRASKTAGVAPAIEFIGGLRNAFIAHLRDQEGVSWDDLQEFVGHTDVRTTRGYVKAFQTLKARKRVAEKAETMRKGSGGA